MLLYGELSILQDFNMVKKKSRPQHLKEYAGVILCKNGRYPL